MPAKKRKKTGLTLKQELFCKLYASDREFFGNGTQSYIEAFDVDLQKRGAYDAARVNASKFLQDANILKRIDELLDHYLNDRVVDKELGFVIKQKAFLSPKVAAISEYNKLRGRITTKIRHKFEGVSDEALKERLADIVTGSDGDSGGAGSEEERK